MMIVRLAETDLQTRFGKFHEILYYDGQVEIIAFIMGEVKGAKNILCRLHSTCLHGHYFNSIECDCREQMERSQQLIQKEGRGIIILLDQEGKGNGHFALLKSIEYKRQGFNQADAYVEAGFKQDARDFRVAAKILNELEVRSIRLITGNVGKTEMLKKYGISVAGIEET